jgi:hypothetical protein
MTEQPQVCPHCGHANERWDQFCFACGQRLSSVQPEGRMHRFFRWLGLAKPADPPPPNREFYREVYRQGPMSHGDGQGLARPRPSGICGPLGLANVLFGDTGDCGVVWSRVEGSRAPRARLGSSENRAPVSANKDPKDRHTQAGTRV